MPKVCLDPVKAKTQALIGYVLAEMKKQKISYAQMGDELGITHQGFSKKIKNQNISIEDFLRICDRLGIEGSEITTLL